MRDQYQPQDRGGIRAARNIQQAPRPPRQAFVEAEPQMREAAKEQMYFAPSLRAQRAGAQ